MAKTQLAPVVAVLNMKGGVGKTTISAHVMRVLYHRHQIKTLLVDLDPQFNLSQALIPRKKYDGLKAENRTILAAMEPPSTVGLHDIKTSTSAPPRAGICQYLNDVLAACFASQWVDLPDEVRTQLESRLPAPRLRDLCRA